MAKKKFSKRGFFAVTHPNGKVGIFHQLGSSVPGTVCVQNCIAEKYTKDTVEMFYGMASSKDSKSDNIRLQFAAGRTAGLLKTADGVYVVEKISVSDPRYRTCAIIKEYTDFFGLNTVNGVLADSPWQPQVYANHLKTIEMLDDFLETLGYTKKAAKKAAKR